MTAPATDRFIPAPELSGVLGLLILYSQALIPMLLATPENPESPILRLIWFPIYLGVFVLGLLSIRQVLRHAVRLPFIVLLIIVVMASVFWSIDAGITFRRGIAIAMTTVFGLVLAARYGWLNLLRLFGLCWLILAVGSFLMGAFVPSLGRMAEVHVGAWQGLWWEKNTLGGFMSRATLLFAVLAFGDRAWRRTWIFALVLSFLLVLLSTSKTALLGALVGFAVVAAGLIVRRGPRFALSVFWLAGVAAAAVIAVVVVNPGLVFELLGRDATLTGRTQIWSALGGMIAERPWLGYGYGTFWEAGSVPGEKVRTLLEWDAPTAHNGWLEVLLSVGYVGLVLFAASFFGFVIRALSQFGGSWGGLYATGFAAQYLLFSVSESIILQQNSLLWVAYVALAGKLAVRSQAAGRIVASPRLAHLRDRRSVA